MIYGSNRLGSGIVAGQTTELPSQDTMHTPSLVTKVLARHEGNIVNIAQTTFKPGDIRKDHVNTNVDEILMALTGTLHVSSGNNAIVLDADRGSYVYLPHNVSQSVSNNSSEPAVLLSIAIRNEAFVNSNRHLEE